MSDIRLIQILKSFSSEEIKEFKSFISSPFFNKEGNYIVKYFDLLKKYYPVFANQTEIQEKIFNAIYSNRKYSQALVNKIHSSLQKLAEEYLRYKSLKEQDEKIEILYLQKLREKKLFPLLEKKHLELQAYFDNLSGKIDKNYYRLQYDYNTELVMYYTDSNKQEKTAAGINAIQKNLILDFAINALDLLTNLEIGKNSTHFNKEESSGELKNYFDFKLLQRYLEGQGGTDSIIFEIFYSRFCAYTDSANDEHYFRFKDLLFKNLDIFTRENKHIMMLSLQNICIRKYRIGNPEFQKELFNVYREMMEKNLYTPREHDLINLSTFRNIFLTALNLKEYEWAESFIETYSALLPLDVREDNYHFALASLYYGKGNLDKALEVLSEVKPSHYMSGLDMKGLMLRIYYERHYFEEVLSLIDAYRHIFTSKRKNPSISATYREANLNFLKFLTQLVKIKTGGSLDEDIEFLQAAIQRTNTVSKPWLLEKISEFLKPSMESSR